MAARYYLCPLHCAEFHCQKQDPGMVRGATSQASKSSNCSGSQVMRCRRGKPPRVFARISTVHRLSCVDLLTRTKLVRQSHTCNRRHMQGGPISFFVAKSSQMRGSTACSTGALGNGGSGRIGPSGRAGP